MSPRLTALKAVLLVLIGFESTELGTPLTFALAFWVIFSPTK